MRGYLPQPLHFETGSLFEPKVWCWSYAGWSASPMRSTCPHSYPEMLEHTRFFRGSEDANQVLTLAYKAFSLWTPCPTPASSRLSVGNSKYQRLSNPKAGWLHLFTLSYWSYRLLIKWSHLLGALAHTVSPSTHKAQVGRSLWAWSQPGFLNETLFQNQVKTTAIATEARRGKVREIIMRYYCAR